MGKQDPVCSQFLWVIVMLVIDGWIMAAAMDKVPR